MSAETLRKAAARMRERAETVTPGPWGVGNGHWIGTGIEQDGAGSFRFDRVLVELDDLNFDPNYQENVSEDTDPDEAVEAHAAHIASWHPTVARAVADWLDDTAERHYEVEWHEETAPGSGELDPDKPLPSFCAACTDDEWVSAIEYGDTIDAAADVVAWPCKDADRALAVAHAYLDGES